MARIASFTLWVSPLAVLGLLHGHLAFEILRSYSRTQDSEFLQGGRTYRIMHNFHAVTHSFISFQW